MKRVDLVFRAEFEFRIKPANPCWGTGFGWGTNTKPVPQPQVNPRLNPRVSDTRADPYNQHDCFQGEQVQFPLFFIFRNIILIELTEKPCLSLSVLIPTTSCSISTDLNKWRKIR